MEIENKLEIWFVAGSQLLYGDDVLAQVAANSREIAQGFNGDAALPVKVVWKPTVKSSGEVHSLCREANDAESCIGLIFWMHTFSPAKMWIAGLSELRKPFVHLHTQFNRDIPWDSIDMDFMNLNQSAHGGREFGHICARLGIRRSVVVGHWQDAEVRAELGVWTGAALGWHESRHLKVARFGDNMRAVAVTEGDKVAAQISFGWQVDGYGLGDLGEYLAAVTDAEVESLLAEYAEMYRLPEEGMPEAAGEQARIELALRRFLDAGGYGAFTTTFENLHGLRQLPGLAVQRLMAAGYGFGAEGDWKTAALLRVVKAAGIGIEGGTSFMEDYTYHFEHGNMQVLGAHMLEVCPSIAAGKPALAAYPLGIGGKEAPARLIFDACSGPAFNMSLIDMGDRFRMVVNAVDAIEPQHDMPQLPVARALWIPRPDLKTAAAAWIFAGGAHHTVYTQQWNLQQIEVFCEIAGIEMVIIDETTELRQMRRVLQGV